jgi:hypothetical protein
MKEFSPLAVYSLQEATHWADQIYEIFVVGIDGPGQTIQGT